MYRISCFHTLLIFVCLGALCKGDDTISASGHLVLRSGKRIECTSIHHGSWSRDGKISFTGIDGVKRTLNLEDLKRIGFESLETDRGYITDDEKTVIVVTLKNGKEAIMRNMEGEVVLHVTFQDPLTSKLVEKERYRIRGASRNSGRESDVISLEFSGAGNIKYNPKSKRYYPVSFNYDPYTGEKLRLKSFDP